MSSSSPPVSVPPAPLAAALSTAPRPAPPRKPAVVIIGPTGAGKSQLGIDLALALNGEVINADVIQMYRALDVASAKVPPAERQGVPHHLLSFLRPRQQFSVRDFRRMAIAAIDDVLARGKLPIVVGGTMYYVQSLIRPSLLEEDEAAAAAAEEEGAERLGGSSAGHASAREVSEAGSARSSRQGASDCGGQQSAAGSAGDAAASASLWEQLRAVDPVMARRLHPNDLRKIERALTVHQTTGLPYSEVIRRQEERLAKGGDAPVQEGPPPDADALSPCIIWVRAQDRGIHATRLDARVDKMMAAGLVEEIQSLQQYLEATPAAAETAALVEEAAAAAAEAHGAAAAAPPASAAAPALSVDAPTPLTLKIVHNLMGEARSGATSAFLGVAGVVGHLMHSPHAAGAAEEGTSALGGASCQGLLQAIGYKEFAAYLAARAATAAAPPPPLPPASSAPAPEVESGCSDAQPPPAKRRKTPKPAPDPVAVALEAGIQALKTTTHGYARKQERWIVNRFQRRGVDMMQVDSSGVEAGGPQWWKTAVVDPALAATQAWLASGRLPEPEPGTAASGGGGAAPPAALSDAARLFTWEQHVCEPCGGRVLNGALAWSEHLASKGHRSALAYQRRREVLEAERGIVLPPFRRAGGGKLPQE